jgi:hypothetical protein
LACFDRCARIFFDMVGCARPRVLPQCGAGDGIYG